MKNLFLVIVIITILECSRYEVPSNARHKNDSTNVIVAKPEIIWPKIIEKGDIVYPDSLRKSNITGIVWVECLIDTFGNIVDAKVIRSDDERLDPFAIKTAFSYKCSPITINGEKMKWKITFPIEFK